MKFSLVQDGRCQSCGETETAWHVLRECQEYEEERRELEVLLDGKGWAFTRRNLVREQETIECFERTSKRILKKKEEMEREQA